ncbi:chromosome 16 open reading frame 89 [Nesidiocoris tenuis]|uniref:Chromosome 16 open reading frame 89 n=1 Tax=Nesidiocoris tenuis TaxID=355587 RepID=A0ABN7B297_9HEMI|nr:chromosome 16 open reading frame 89 [Nesidiocoris tenuis]
MMKKPQIKSLPLPTVQAPYELENGLEEGSPTRAESDTCLLGLLIDGIVADGCETLERDSKARGYTLLHQGIYFTIKAHLKFDEVTAQEEIRRICAQMLAENRQIRRMGFPTTLQDLFVEQVAVCGVNKFGEFLTDGTVRMIQSLQTSRGCFALIEKGKRLSIDCYNHLSSVAAAAIATFLSA